MPQYSRVSLLIMLLLPLYAVGIMRAKACPLYCLEVEYMTCESSGDKKFRPSCINCCLAPKDCTLHLPDGSYIPCKPI
ncbi:serine-type endopeptidase inhibitors [Euphorbia peplus]|nr:serine-type endopeptidase inhibitors [Euphorbia peplus]